MGAVLTDEDHSSMDDFLAQTFDAVRAGVLTKDQFIEHLAYALTALDTGNRREARWYFKAGNAWFQPARDAA